MHIRKTAEQYNAQIATIVDHENWVKTRAREIDPDSELSRLADIVDNIMRYFKVLCNFAGVSSNNVYWTLTQTPIRLIYVPITEGECITLVNPEILKLEGKKFFSVEGCGSIPDDNYIVTRKPYVSVSGYTLKREYIELEYGSRDQDMGEEPVLLSYCYKACIIQHEMDHLDGITIKDKGTLFALETVSARK